MIDTYIRETHEIVSEYGTSHILDPGYSTQITVSAGGREKRMPASHRFMRLVVNDLGYSRKHFVFNGVPMRN